MSLSAWEWYALDSIEGELAGSAPRLVALVSAFNRLASDEEMPDRGEIQAGPRRAPCRARSRSCLRRMRRYLGIQHAAVLLWLLITFALLATGLALNAAGDHGPCTGKTEMAAMACVGQAPRHSPGSPSQNTSTGQSSRQGVASIPQAGP
jgi:hypothetical protein